MAFGRLDAMRPGFPVAVAAARDRGFEAVLRSPGGRAAAYDQGTLAFDHVVPLTDHLRGLHETFVQTSCALAGALGALGLDARVGAVPGEYCRGDYSVNLRGRAKVVGTAQRRIRGAALLGGFLTVHGAAGLRAVLEPVYRALELDWDPGSLGAIEDDLPAITIARAQAVIISALAPVYEDTPGQLDDATRALAGELEHEHAVAATATDTTSA